MSAPKPPPPPPPPAVPRRDDRAVQAAGKEESRRQRLRKGLRSTILTSGQGLLSKATVARKALLGE